MAGQPRNFSGFHSQKPNFLGESSALVRKCLWQQAKSPGDQVFPQPLYKEAVGETQTEQDRQLPGSGNLDSAS